MGFINGNIIRFGAVVICASTVFFLSLNYLLSEQLYKGIFVLTPLYMMTLFLSGLYFGRTDTSKAYGFNYHLVTYICCIATPMIMHQLGLLPARFANDAMDTALYWGIGLFIHFLLFLFVRKHGKKYFA